MRFHDRLFQLKHWFGGQDMFSVCGQLHKSQRDTGGVIWKDMSAFQKPFVSPAPPRLQQEVASEMVDVVTLLWTEKRAEDSVWLGWRRFEGLQKVF